MNPQALMLKVSEAIDVKVTSLGIDTPFDDPNFPYTQDQLMELLSCPANQVKMEVFHNLLTWTGKSIVIVNDD